MWIVGYHDGMSAEAIPTPKSFENPDVTFEKALDAFEARAGFIFQDRDLLKQAFTRESYTVAIGGGSHNRLVPH